MKFVADFHIHSKYSMATSKDCDLPHLWAWAKRKGINLVGTGDFTHPQWAKEISQQLEPAEQGLFKLKDKFKKGVAQLVPKTCDKKVRFILTSEISSIYKRGGKTRKVHNLLVAPSIDSASKIANALGKIGNIKSDGRPILGLDSRDLFKIVLDSNPENFLVPAHIWTPWFSVLGSKSGFDSIKECYGELADEIFAVETGLSSDPPMNWRLSMLDRFTLISNSDAHSPGKLGRNANIFDCDLDFSSVKNGLKTGKGFLGTIDLFPDLGKYHLDGHRKCNVCFTPKETLDNGGLCPVCGKPVTVGVMSRVDELADQKDGVKPKGAADFIRQVPLPEILAEIIGQNVGTKKVTALHEKLIYEIGDEFQILLDEPEESLALVAGPIVAKAIERVRKSELLVEAGYDGKYGVVKIFSKTERSRFK